MRRGKTSLNKYKCFDESLIDFKYIDLRYNNQVIVKET